MTDFEMPKKFKNPKKNNFLKLLIVMIIAFGLACLIILKLYLSSLPPIENLEDFKPNIVTQIYSADGEIIKTFTAYRFEKISIREVPEHLKEAIIATEDKNFYTHDGYDLFGLARSILANLKAGRMVQGASTLTQQLARILFLSNEKTFDRKIKEIIISARIEKTLSKDKILEMYLNNVYLGSGAYGIAGASNIYFDKPLSKLTLAENALIAGLPQAPSVYSPFNNTKLAKQRRNQVLTRMYKMRYITKQEYKQALDEPITLSPNRGIYSFNRAPYFVDYVMDELESLGFDETDISQGGYKITTTLNYKAQQAADEAVKKNMKAWGMTKDKQQAAVFGFSPISGEVLVYVGGKDYNKSQYDRVSQAIRPPGSSFKPFVFATAIDKGWGVNDVIEDTKVQIGKWAPRNYGDKYRGKIALYQAATVSSNVAAVRLIEDTGIRPVINTARALGITTPIEYDYTISLGSNGVKLYDMTVAYGAFANGGFRVKPYAVERVETSRGKVVYQAPKTKITKVLETGTAGSVTIMLKEAVLHGTGRAAYIGKPMAGKTGTTDSCKDAWFMGYTPDISMGVWVGNDDNSRMYNLTGGTVPAMIWRDTMKIATQDIATSDFDYPKVELIPIQEQVEEEESNPTGSPPSNSTSLVQDAVDGLTRDSKVILDTIHSNITNTTKPKNQEQPKNITNTFSDIPVQAPTPAIPAIKPPQAPQPQFQIPATAPAAQTQTKPAEPVQGRFH